MVRAGISLCGHTELHGIHGENLTGVKYRDENLDAFFQSYAAAIGIDFILMNDNAGSQRAMFVDDLDVALSVKAWNERNGQLNPI